MYNITYKPILIAPVVVAVLTMIDGPQDVYNAAKDVMNHFEQTAFAAEVKQVTHSVSLTYTYVNGTK
jgi:hypothetical protein